MSWSSQISIRILLAICRLNKKIRPSFGRLYRQVIQLVECRTENPNVAISSIALSAMRVKSHFISLVSSEEEPRFEAPHVGGSRPPPAAMRIGRTVKISPS